MLSGVLVSGWDAKKLLSLKRGGRALMVLSTFVILHVGNVEMLFAKEDQEH